MSAKGKAKATEPSLATTKVLQIRIPLGQYQIIQELCNQGYASTPSTWVKLLIAAELQTRLELKAAYNK